MQNELQRVLNLAKKTGDRVIVFDHFDNERTYVVMPLDEYEGMVDGGGFAKGLSPVAPTKERAKGEDLTEGEMIDKINRDIAQWKNESDFNIPSYAKTTEGKSVSKEKEVIFEPKPQVKNPPAGGDKKPVKKNNWSISKTVKESAEQVMEEDKPYSEEVSF